MHTSTIKMHFAAHNNILLYNHALVWKWQITSLSWQRVILNMKTYLAIEWYNNYTTHLSQNSLVFHRSMISLSLWLWQIIDCQVPQTNYDNLFNLVHDYSTNYFIRMHIFSKSILRTLAPYQSKLTWQHLLQLNFHYIKYKLGCSHCLEASVGKI